MKTPSVRPLVFVLLACVLPISIRSQGTAFTYQGVLKDAGSPANGAYDLAFSLFSASAGDGQVGSTLTNTAVALSNGQFTVCLDFGSGSFPGADRWLEIGVRANSSNDFTTLSPRQKLNPAPYAIAAGTLIGSLPGDRLAGTFSNVVIFNNPANAFGGSFSGDGAALANLNAANLSSGVVPLVRGGTGADTPSAARSSLGAAASGPNSDINSLSGLSTPLSLAQGGTGAGTATDALVNLGASSLTASNTFTGVNVLSNSNNSFIGTFTGDGSALSGLGAANLSSGVVPVVRGGTGADTPAAARSSLGAAASGANSDITSL
ncbi:MAG: hypothetical protein QOJ40_1125, partial [Verrucomicrobiota bacterium]